MISSAPKLLIFVLIFLLALAFSSPTLAQFEGSSLDVGYTFDIADPKAEIGDILINTDKGLVLATEAFSNKLFGVVQQQPVLVFKTKDGTGRPVARTGVVEVNVTTLGGAISAGDYITSSEITGKGQKATLSGYVIGVAMAPLKEAGQTTEVKGKTVYSGKIPVALRVEYAELTNARSASRLLDSVNTAFFQNVQSPQQFLNIFRYIAAGFVTLIGFGFGFFTFSRSLPKGIEAIGRNPLAEKAILFSIVLNIVLIVLSAGISIVGAVIILRL